MSISPKESQPSDEPPAAAVLVELADGRVIGRGEIDELREAALTARFALHTAPTIAVGSKVKLVFPAIDNGPSLFAHSTVHARREGRTTRSYDFVFVDTPGGHHKLQAGICERVARRKTRRVPPAPEQPVRLTLTRHDTGGTTTAVATDISSGGVAFVLPGDVETLLRDAVDVGVKITLPSGHDVTHTGRITSRTAMTGGIRYGLWFPAAGQQSTVNDASKLREYLTRRTQELTRPNA